MRMRRNAWRWIGVTCVAMVCALSGCVAGQQFRAAAGSSLEDGVRSITTGLLDGIFAVFDSTTTSG